MSQVVWVVIKYQNKLIKKVDMGILAKFVQKIWSLIYLWETDLSFDFANEGTYLGANEINFMDLAGKMAS